MIGEKQRSFKSSDDDNDDVNDDDDNDDDDIGMKENIRKSKKRALKYVPSSNSV